MSFLFLLLFFCGCFCTSSVQCWTVADADTHDWLTANFNDDGGENIDVTVKGIDGLKMAGFTEHAAFSGGMTNLTDFSGTTKSYKKKLGTAANDPYLFIYKNGSKYYAFTHSTGTLNTADTFAASAGALGTKKGFFKTGNYDSIAKALGISGTEGLKSLTGSTTDTAIDGSVIYELAPGKFITKTGKVGSFGAAKNSSGNSGGTATSPKEDANLKKSVDKNKGGVAAAMALSTICYSEQGFSVSGGFGAYDGETAFALGGSYREGQWAGKMGMAFSEDEVSFNGGVTYQM
jgi:hypothetical protein